MLHICFSNGWGGLEQYPLTLESEFLNQGIQPYYIGKENTRFSESAKSQGFQLRTFSSRLALIAYPHAFKKWLKENNIEAIHFHKSTDLRLAPFLKMLTPKTRLVFTEHMNAKKPKKHIYHQLVYRCIDQVISISDHSLGNNKKALPVPTHKIRKIYSGIDLRKFKPNLTEYARKEIRAELGLKNEIAFCLPGRFSSGKGHKIFVESFIRFSKLKDAPSAHAFLIGGVTADKGADEQLVSDIKQDIEEKEAEHLFTFTGYRPDMHRILQAMDVVCIPSRLEAFGLTIVEAMALGLPVIGSNSGAVPEILGKDGQCGLLANPGNPHSFTDAFIKLSNDAVTRKTLGANALKRAHQLFDIRNHVKELKKIYKQK